MRTQLLALSVAVLWTVGPVRAQQPQQLTEEDYARAERFLSEHVTPFVTGIGIRPTWMDDGRFWYRTTTEDGEGLFIVDPADATRDSVFEPDRLGAALVEASGNGEVADGNVEVVDVGDDARSISVRLDDGQRWRCDLDDYTCAQEDTVPDWAPRSSRLSPDGQAAAFIRDHNLWVVDSTGVEVQATTDGIEDFGYATDNAGWTRSDSPVITWSPDSKKIATFQHDGRGVGEMYLVTTNVGQPKLEAWKYPLPGDSVIFRISRVIVDLEAPGGPRVVQLEMPPDAHRSTVSDHIACGGSICDLQWYPDGSHVAFVSSSRDHKTAWFRVANAETGEVTTLFEERMPTQIGNASLSSDLWRVLPSSSELIWWSQRDDWVHLYLYDLTTGGLKNRITTGEGNVEQIVHVDETARTIYYLGAGKQPGRDPYFDHLYRIGFDGESETLLTPEEANHVVAMSADGSFFVDSYSTPDTPPVTVLRDREGNQLMTLEEADASRLLATGWKPPTPIRMKARDGTTDIYGLMYTPSSMDSTAKYPIVNNIYPGPQSGSVGSRSFTPARGDNQALAELGFVVVEIDGMGTPGRSKTFADAYFGSMGDNTLPDQIAGMRELAEQYPFIDIGRAGIWGHSGGGFAAAAAMFKHPDFFKVGISESGNHDNRNYEDDWGERYQGLLVPSDGGDSYEAEANPIYAGNLQGKLLLAHGGMDGNVPPYNTMLVVDALIAAAKDFDLLIFPNAGHGYGEAGNYMMRRRWDYFVRHLMGAEPPREYRIGELPEQQ
ncbi:MAG: prolyl oligopeptidase family serine peptidase [Gemmatimonas sp.]|nr:prolyl oligopeptidase family serine peptidase [Gemmatimonas sp.]